MQGKSTTPRHSQRRHALGIRSAVGYSAGDPHTHMHRLCHSTPYTSTRRIFAVVQRETDTYTRTLKYFSAALLEKQQSDYGTPATQASNNFAENFKPRGADDPAGPRSEKHTPPQPACLYPHSTPLHSTPPPQHRSTSTAPSANSNTAPHLPPPSTALQQTQRPPPHFTPRAPRTTQQQPTAHASPLATQKGWREGIQTTANGKKAMKVQTSHSRSLSALPLQPHGRPLLQVRGMFVLSGEVCV